MTRNSETTPYPDHSDTLRTLPGYPWLPCPICRGVEGCDHTVPERARAALPALQLESVNA